MQPFQLNTFSIQVNSWSIVVT